MFFTAFFGMSISFTKFTAIISSLADRYVLHRKVSFPTSEALPVDSTSPLQIQVRFLCLIWEFHSNGTRTHFAFSPLLECYSELKGLFWFFGLGTEFFLYFFVVHVQDEHI